MVILVLVIPLTKKQSILSRIWSEMAKNYHQLSEEAGIL
jgi:hypothetical protein